MVIRLTRSVFLFGTLFCMVVGCAEPVADVDRTQPNLIRKSDLEGEWYMMQTITNVPSGAWFTFIGETSMTERIRWEIQENLLVAYRSYPYIRGADSPSVRKPFDGKENPVAAYPILAHVDVRRDYNSTTGEQSNVIIENTFDRPWFERDFVRVDWSTSTITNFEFIAPMQSITEGAYFVPEELGDHDDEYKEIALYTERDDNDRIKYFDVLGRLFVVPSEYGCFWITGYISTDDCTSSEVDMRTSFSRLPAKPDYEKFHYDDQLLSRFGYYRSEYLVYDEQRGITDMARRFMINRHNIWKKSKDGDAFIPLPERFIRTIPYYLSADWPTDPLLEAAAFEAIKQWNDALRIGLDAAGVNDKSDVFVLCHNPVVDGDHEACGDAGFAPRIGDLRYSSLHWVDGMNIQNPLGYGPSAVDPITGEIISGKAYIYGSEISQWATRAVDMIRYLNEDLDLNTIVTGQHFIGDVIDRIASIDTIDRHSRALDRKDLSKMTSKPQRTPRRRMGKKELKSYDRQDTIDRMKRAKEAGARAHKGNPEVTAALSRTIRKKWSDATPEQRDRLDPTISLNPAVIQKRRALHRHAREHSVDMKDFLVPNIEGLLRTYRGRTDYETMWREIRAEIFAATAEHEVGHTLGLRHNFQGSYDSLNYPDEYWRLREENLFKAESVGDIYRLTTLTENQHNAQMRQMQYSSIMDYGYNWQNDLNGLGKYDRAAIIFGYTSGTYRAVGPVCDLFDGVPDGNTCSVQLPGLVEVFNKRRSALGEAGVMLDGREAGYTYDDSGLPSINILERYHYTTIALGFPSLDDLSDQGRTWINYGEYIASKTSDDRLMRVPYLFCSDEWAGGLVSCHLFDQGADPFEIARTYAQHYRAYYPFDNFRMDNPFFEIWWPLDSYSWRIFMPLSDIFQSWYVAPWGYDDLFDRVYELATQTGFNLLAEVLATPEYGDWCENNAGQLIHLGNDPFLQGAPPRSPNCAADGRRYTIPPGEGRRLFSVYDPAFGYYFPDKPQEAGHYWATLGAVWALTDPEAYILGVDGDAGTYAIGYFDWFTEEFRDLMNQLLTRDFGRFAPYAGLSGQTSATGSPELTLKYQPPSTVVDDATGAAYDPETGRSVDVITGPQALCEPCTANEECVGYNGRYGGVFCEALFDGEPSYCVRDCSLDPGVCPVGTYCDGGTCYPNGDDCANAVADCSPDRPAGRCNDGICINGACTIQSLARLVQSEPSFSILTDIAWYGFSMTTSSFSTAFNDQLNIFRPGTTSEVDVVNAGRAERVTFTNPITGVSYAAVQALCPDGTDTTTPGSVPICGACFADEDCSGYTGYTNDIFCQPIDVGGADYYCLRDCFEDAQNCAAGEICNAEGNCVPADGVCQSSDTCSAQQPNGMCTNGNVCLNGACVTEECAAGNVADTGAVLLVKKGIELADNYEKALNAWYQFNGDPATSDLLLDRSEEAKYELQNHTDLIEAILATYTIFGRIY